MAALENGDLVVVEENLAQPQPLAGAALVQTARRAARAPHLAAVLGLVFVVVDKYVVVGRAAAGTA